MINPVLDFPKGYSPDSFDAYLYDCDGTLADTMGPHVEAWVAECADHGVELDGALIYELAGMPAVQTVKIINERLGSTLDPYLVAERKEQRFKKYYFGSVKPVEPVVSHLKEMARLGKKIAVVSGGLREVVSETLRKLDVFHLVPVLVCAEDVSRGKPHPEPYLKAAQLLGVEPSRCLVFEDADFGIESALRAQMQVVRV